MTPADRHGPLDHRPRRYAPSAESILYRQLAIYSSSQSDTGSRNSCRTTSTTSSRPSPIRCAATFCVGSRSRSAISPRSTIRWRTACAGQIDQRAGLSQSTVSAHLATLQKAGLVTRQKVGQWHFFKRNDAVIQTFIERIGGNSEPFSHHHKGAVSLCPRFSTRSRSATELNNRIIMAPLTRCRAEPGRVPGDLIAEYYAQRADAGLIISEATSVTPMGVGYPDTPGIWSAEQVQGWKKVTDAVHGKGGKIVLQLWHVGRISDPLYLDGQLPVAPSALKPAGHVSLVRPKKDYETPRALEIDEIPGIIEAYRKGLRMPRKPVSTVSRSMAPTAICSISSCRTAPTSAPTPTVAHWKTVHDCCWK